MAERSSSSGGLLGWLEVAGNRLPDPVVLFGVVAASIVAVSAAAAGATVSNPLTHVPVSVESLASGAMLRRMWTDAVRNFVAFPPLGNVLVAVMGIGVAERSGLFAAALGRAITRIPPAGLTAALLFFGANAAIASDASFVVVVPLGATLWARVGRHPLAGLTLAYAAVSGAYGSNLLITAMDPLLSGLTEGAARLVDPSAHVPATCNWAFNAASVFLITGVGLLLAPRMERGFGPWALQQEPLEAEPRLGPTGVALGLTLLALLGIATFTLRSDDGSWAPVYDSIVPLIAVLCLVPGLVFAWSNGRIRDTAGAARLASEAVGGMGGYIVLAFAAAQFVAWFNWSNLGMVSAVRGAALLRELNLGPTLLLAALVLLSAGLNLIVVSASAKWALMAPLFVPMFMLLGLDPATTQAAYRVGDAFTNTITPLMPYLPIVLAAARRYVPDAGLGTLLAPQFPFALAFGVAWTGMLLLWNAGGWPLGVG